jgi:hypothetical protein
MRGGRVKGMFSPPLLRVQHQYNLRDRQPAGVPRGEIGERGLGENARRLDGRRGEGELQTEKEEVRVVVSGVG